MEPAIQVTPASDSKCVSWSAFILHGCVQLIVLCLMDFFYFYTESENPNKTNPNKQLHIDNVADRC